MIVSPGHWSNSRNGGPGAFGVLLNGVSGITESWGLKLLCYLLCLQGSDTEEKESRSSVTSSPNDKQIDPALWLWQSKQGWKMSYLLRRGVWGTSHTQM